MKKMLLFIAVYSFTLLLTAQEKIFEHDVSSFPKPRLIGTSVHTDFSSPLFHSVLLSKTQLRHSYLSETGQKKEITVHTADQNPDDSLLANANADKNIINLYRYSKYLLHVPGSKKLTDVLYKSSTSKYYIVSTDVKTGVPVISDTIGFPFDTELVGCYFYSTSIILVHHKLRKDEFIITTIKDDQKVKREEIKIDYQDDNSSALLRRPIGTNIINDNVVIPATNLWLPVYFLDYNSLTFEDGKYLKILVGGNSLNTWFIQLDITAGNYIIKKFTLPETGNEEIKNYPSSWLTDSILISGYTTETELRLYFYELSTDSLINFISITKDNIKQFTSSGITKSGDFWSKSNITEISFSDFLKKCNANKLLITGYKDGNEIFLTLSSKYDLGPTSTFLGNIVTLGTMDFRQVKPPSIVSFNMSLKLGKIKPGFGEVKNFVWEKILMFIWGIRSYSTSADITFKDGYYYISYINKDTKKIVVHRFYKYL